MPEAAEVRVAAAQLHSVLVGRSVIAADVSHPRTVRSMAGANLDRFTDSPVVSVRAAGKWIVVDLGAAGTLGIHLRMSGQVLLVEPSTPEPDRHVHGRIDFGSADAAAVESPARQSCAPAPTAALGAPGTDPGAPVRLWFRDPRTFGEWRWPSPSSSVPDIEAVTADDVHRLARTRSISGKALLLDQQLAVRGVGSYVADEAFARAGVCPARPACDLSVQEWSAVLDRCRAVVDASTRVGGVTLADEGWCDVWGRSGQYAEQFMVHARDTCANCGSQTVRAVLSGRGTRWCPSCQPRIPSAVAD